MSNDMLDKIARQLVTMPVEIHGVVMDLLSKIPNDEWLVATKRFLRKENPWPAQIKLWERISDIAIRVNLDVNPKLPFKDAKVEWDNCSGWGLGWVTVERRGDDLYVDGKMVVFHLVEGQKTGRVQGYELRTQLQGQATLHPNVLDALFENQRLIPESWKVDEQGRTRFIYFWAVGFRDSDCNLYVRFLSWLDGAWGRDDGWLIYHLDDENPAAVLAS
jgi:hypothetical protein